MPVSFSKDILPLFSARDITCMLRVNVRLSDYGYMSDTAGDGPFADHAGRRRNHRCASMTVPGPTEERLPASTSGMICLKCTLIGMAESDSALLFQMRHIMSPQNLPVAVDEIVAAFHARLIERAAPEAMSGVEEPQIDTLIDELDVSVLARGGPLARLFRGYTPREIAVTERFETVDTQENRYVKYFLEECLMAAAGITGTPAMPKGLRHVCCSLFRIVGYRNRIFGCREECFHICHLKPVFGVEVQPMAARRLAVDQGKENAVVWIKEGGVATVPSCQRARRTFEPTIIEQADLQAPRRDRFIEKAHPASLSLFQSNLQTVGCDHNKGAIRRQLTFAQVSQ